MGVIMEKRALESLKSITEGNRLYITRRGNCQAKGLKASLSLQHVFFLVGFCGLRAACISPLISEFDECTQDDIHSMPA